MYIQVCIQSISQQHTKPSFKFHRQNINKHTYIIYILHKNCTQKLYIKTVHNNCPQKISIKTPFIKRNKQHTNIQTYNNKQNTTHNIQHTNKLHTNKLNTKIIGPAPKGVIQEDDVIDEAFKYYRANVFFKHFKINNPADRVFIYITLYIQACIQASQKSANSDEAKRALTTLAVGNFSMPGDPRFPINAMFSAPGSSAESEQLRHYLQQIRNEVR